MSNPSSSPYTDYLDETKRAIDKCYPKKKEITLIGASTLLFEINENPDKYPRYSKLKLERNKKLVMTRNCIDDLDFQLWGKSRGSCRNGAVYKRSL